ncbi:unnamed protein product [Absidia cylindrospora]
MKQTSQAAPDFTELIQHVHNIVAVNKQFSAKLTKFAGNAQAAQELGNTLMQWVKDLESPYANYSRCYIPNLNQRTDILANRSIDQLLKDLSRSASYDISLESLFNAPIQQLKYYYGLYARLLDSADPGRPDFKHLTDATRCLETILALSQKPSTSKSGLPVLPPPIRTQPDNSASSHKVPKKKKSFVQQDFFAYYTETGEVSPLESSDDDDFDGYDAATTTTNGRNDKDGMDKKNASAGGDDDLSTIQPRTVKMLNALPADPKVAKASASTNTPPTSVPKKDTSAQVQMTYIQPATAKVHKLDDNTTKTSTTTTTPAAPTTTSHVDTVRAALATPPSQRTLSPVPGDSPRPVSPRAVQVQQAVTPVAAMQAVSQKTHDYFSIPSNNTSSKPLPSPKDQSPGAGASPSGRPNGGAALPRTSSKRGTAQNVDPTARSAQQNTPSAKPLNSQPPTMARPYSPVSNTNPRAMNNNTGPPMQPPKSPMYAPGQQQQQQQQPRPMNNMYNQGPSGAPVPHHQQQQRQMQPPPLLRSSSHNSMEQQQQQQQQQQQGYGMPPHPQPPRMNSNGPHPMPSRSTGTATPVYQQRPPLPPQQMGARPPMHSPAYQQPRTPPPTDDQHNSVRQVLYSSNQCEVFHWKAQSWYAVDGQCTLQVRLTHGGRSCLAVQLQPSNQLYLNAWILPSMAITQPSPTDVSVSVTMMAQQENYLIHFRHPADASNLLAILHRMHHESTTQPPSSSSPPPSSMNQQKPRLARQETTAVELRDDTPSVEQVPQTLKPVFQCKCKLFVQSETSKWNPMGSTAMRISQQLPSQKMHIYIEDDKNKLISSIVRSGNVERLTSKRITFLLTNDQDKSSMVYLLQLKDEQTGNKIYDYLKTQNAAHGW